MAATITWYGPGASHVFNGAVDWDTDAIKVMLVGPAYSPLQDTHDFRDDISAEITGTGYTAGGATLATKVRSYDGPTNEVRLDADDLTWIGLDPVTAFRYGIIYKARGGAASADELVGWIDFGADQDPGGTDFIIQWATTGVLKAVVA
jgi:hypothetical protein